MYLTRLAIDPRGREARRDLADVYEMHRSLARAFTPASDTPPGRFLWRLEPTGNYADPIVLVQSAQAGDWSALSSRQGYFKCEPQTKLLDTAKLVGGEGDLYRFRLFANPTVARDGKRYGLGREAEQLAWLERKASRHGFVPEMAMVTCTDRVSARKGQSIITLQRACFDGILRVADMDRVKMALAQGIGPGKAFGCGLLSLARR